MEARDIVAGLYNHLVDKSDNHPNVGKLAFLSNVITPSTFTKSIKTFTYTVWYLQGNKKEELLTITDSATVINKLLVEAMNSKMDKLLIDAIFKFLSSHTYKKIIHGEYTL